MMRHSSLIPAALVFATSALAQVPEGWGVMSAHYSADQAVTVFSPRTDEASTPITGLPDEVRLTIGVANGASAVALMPDGRIAVGNWAGRDGRPVVVHVLTLNGFAVASSQRFLVGTSFSSGGTITQIQALPDGRLLFSAASIRSGSRVGLIDPAAGTVRPVVFRGVLASDVNALAVSDDGSEVYLGYWQSPSAGAIYRASLTTGLGSLITATPHGVTGLDVDNDGNLVVAMNNAADGFARVDLATSTLTPVPNTPRSVGAIAVERATGNVIYLTSTTPSSGRGAMMHVTGSPDATQVARFSSGTLSGLDLSESPRAYGVGTPGANSYRWLARPNPDGLPTLGNFGFGITLESTPNAASASLLMVSPNRASVAVSGVEVLVDLATAAILPMPNTPLARVALPIPNDPQLAGLTLHAQSLHVEAGGLATSNGITIGVVRP